MNNNELTNEKVTWLRYFPIDDYGFTYLQAYRLIEKMFRDRKPHTVKKLSKYLEEQTELTEVLCRQFETVRALKHSFSKTGKLYYQYDPTNLRVDEIIKRDLLDFWIREEKIPYSPTFQ